MVLFLSYSTINVFVCFIVKLACKAKVVEKRYVCKTFKLYLISVQNNKIFVNFNIFYSHLESNNILFSPYFNSAMINVTETSFTIHVLSNIIFLFGRYFVLVRVTKARNTCILPVLFIWLVKTTFVSSTSYFLLLALFFFWVRSVLGGHLFREHPKTQPLFVDCCCWFLETPGIELATPGLNGDLFELI